MKYYLFLLHRTDPDNTDYDQYRGCVVSAINETDARNTHPNGKHYEDVWFKHDLENWVKPEDVICSLIGASFINERKVILADFNAG
jgi:TPP-dependent 2-oxoacid decarboxylase